MRVLSIWLPAILLTAVSIFAADPVAHLTVTSRDGENVIEWQNPSTSVDVTRIIGRPDRFATSATDFRVVDFVEDVAGAPDEHRSTVHPGLSPGVDLFYAAFVDDGTGFSTAVEAKVYTIDASAGVFWAFHIGDGTTSMAPPGIGVNVMVGSNDGTLYGMERGASGGVWPAGYEPLATGFPIQHRPPVVPISGITTAAHFTLVGVQDGSVRAVDAETGALLWATEDEGVFQASPAASLLRYGGPGLFDLALTGTRNGGADNVFIAHHLVDGRDEWTFKNSDGGGLGLGIISGGASLDYAHGNVYFASFERTTGASTLFALTIDEGKRVWRRAIGNVSSSPVVRGDVIYVAADDGTLYAIDVTDGSDRVPPADTGDRAVKAFVFPDFSGTRIYFSTTNALHCFEDTGTALERCWTFDVAAPSTPLYPPGSPFLWIGAGDGVLYQIDVATGDTGTAPDTAALPLGDGGAGVGAPSFDVRNGAVYVGSEDGVIYAVSAPY